MRTSLLALIAATVAVGAAQASDDRYDEKLAQAAAQMAASRMGDLRGGLEPDAGLVLVEQIAPTMEGESRRPGVWHNGLAIAVERRSTVSPEL